MSGYEKSPDYGGAPGDLFGDGFAAALVMILIAALSGAIVWFAL